MSSRRGKLYSVTTRAEKGKCRVIMRFARAGNPRSYLYELKFDDDDQQWKIICVGGKPPFWKSREFRTLRSAIRRHYADRDEVINAEFTNDRQRRAINQPRRIRRVEEVVLAA